MTKRVRFIMVGGFLGAGKTTTIGQLALHYMDQGLKVGVVTNDQAYDLVDTHSMRANGLTVEEVPGACFCCKFNDLVDVASKLAAENLPDIILAEPVGSCTDLVATVIEPMRQIHGERFEVGPLAVLLKPEHGEKILRGDSQVGFSPKAAYIFLKQVEEADIIVINKIDKLSPSQRRDLEKLVRERFPKKEILLISSQTGENFDSLIRALARDVGVQNRELLEIDYDIYAAGEAELGWLNCSVALDGKQEENFSLDELVVSLVQHLADSLLTHDAEPAHLKVYGESQGDVAVANLVCSGVPADLSRSSNASVEQAELVVNARVAVDPNLLARVVEEQVSSVAEQFGTSWSITDMQHFRPGRPVPTHRVSEIT